MIYPEQVKNMARGIIMDVRAKNQWNGRDLKAVIYKHLPQEYHQGARRSVEKVIPDRGVFVSTDKGYKTLKKCLRSILNDLYKTRPDLFAAPPRANDDEKKVEPVLSQNGEILTQKHWDVRPNDPIR